MNKNIQALRALAVTTVEIVNPDTFTTHHREFFDEEKFAELIAWECIDLSLGSSHRDDDMGAIIANKIKRHFGVKE
jgi:hypothetical protein